MKRITDKQRLDFMIRERINIRPRPSMYDWSVEKKWDNGDFIYIANDDARKAIDEMISSVS